MITINATGDTTIHTANKYCLEDILVKVPKADNSSGGSGGNFDVATVTFTNDSITECLYGYISPDGIVEDWMPGYTTLSVQSVTPSFFVVANGLIEGVDGPAPMFSDKIRYILGDCTLRIYR